jgi:hypothetical protein
MLESKISFLKDTFFISYQFKPVKNLKTVIFKVKCHMGGGGVRKAAKSITYQLKGPELFYYFFENFKAQYKQLNVFTLGQIKSDNTKQANDNNNGGEFHLLILSKWDN